MKNLPTRYVAGKSVVYEEGIRYAPPGANKKRESEITREICDWLHEQKLFFWRQNNVPIFDPRKKIFRAQPKYTPKGLPDILCLIKGKLIGLEVKVPNYWKLTDPQMEMNERFTKNGAIYKIVTSLQDVQSMAIFALASQPTPQGFNDD